jgi:hypothetical protein
MYAKVVFKIVNKFVFTAAGPISIYKRLSFASSTVSMMAFAADLDNFVLTKVLLITRVTG